MVAAAVVVVVAVVAVVVVVVAAGAVAALLQHPGEMGLGVWGTLSDCDWLGPAQCRTAP